MTEKPNRFGPVWLQPGVSTGNMLTLMLGGYTTIGLLTFVALGTPHVLTVYLGVSGMRLLNHWAPNGRPVGRVVSALTVASLLVGAFARVLTIERRTIRVARILRGGASAIRSRG